MCNRIKPPPGFKAPEGSGEEIDIVCTFKVQDDGTLQLTKLGDTEMPEGEEMEDETEENPQFKPSYADYAQSIQSEYQS